MIIGLITHRLYLSKENNNVLALFHRLFPHSVLMWGIFHGILSVPHNIVMDLNNVMLYLILL